MLERRTSTHSLDTNGNGTLDRPVLTLVGDGFGVDGLAGLGLFADVGSADPPGARASAKPFGFPALLPPCNCIAG
ncbi:MAG: hypothetical protein ACKPKO_59740, partial [Candidatus Fonsibacter sp.]